MAFGSCSRSQLVLIFGNTLAFFVAGILLGYGIYVFAYMRTTNTAVVCVCIGASAGVMIATAMGAWGSLLKKHGVLKVYFYTVLLLDILLLVTGALCFIRSAEVVDYVEYDFQTVKDAMPDSMCSDYHITTSSGISSCKDDMTDKLQGNLEIMGGASIFVAVMMFFGLIVSGRLLTWDRLTGPLLSGGGIVMICFAIFILGMSISIILNMQDVLEQDAYATYIAVAASAMIMLLGIVGIVGMNRRSTCTLMVYQVLGFLCIIILFTLAILAFSQCTDLTKWTTDNFDTGNNIRDSLDECYCNNDDYSTSCGSGANPYCNAKDSAGDLIYYTCTDGSCVRNSTNSTAAKYCLSTALCVDKAVDGPQGSLAAIGTMSCFYLLYLVVCIAACRNVSAKLVEEQRQEGGMQLASIGVGKKTERDRGDKEARV